MGTSTKFLGQKNDRSTRFVSRTPTNIRIRISKKNTVDRIDRPAGTKCPLAIIFSDAISIQEFAHTFRLPEGVKIWENRDAHYPLEIGVICERTGQATAGPVKG